MEFLILILTALTILILFIVSRGNDDDRMRRLPLRVKAQFRPDRPRGGVRRKGMWR